MNGMPFLGEGRPERLAALGAPATFPTPLELRVFFGSNKPIVSQYVSRFVSRNLTDGAGVCALKKPAFKASPSKGEGWAGPP